MKIIPESFLSQNEAAHTLSPDAAVSFIQRTANPDESIVGVRELRGSTPAPFTSGVIERVRSGQWRLFDEREASVFNWGMHEGWAREQQRSSQMKTPTEPLKIEKKPSPPLWVISSYRRQPLNARKCSHGAKGRLVTAMTDAMGLLDCPHTAHDDQMLVQMVQ